MKQGTIAELAQTYKVNPIQMNGAIHFLLAVGKAELVGPKERPAGTKGKPSMIYSVDIEPKTEV